MNSPSATAVLDTEYRKMVSDAAGEAYLDTMTADCLQQVQSFITLRPQAGEATRSQAHRLAGGTATVGLPALAAALKAMEKACGAPLPDDAWQVLVTACETCLGEAYEAVGADASTRSSR